MVLNPHRGDDWCDLTISIERLIGIAGRWLPVMTLLSFLPYLLIWGLPELPGWTGIGEALVSILRWTAIGGGIYVLSALIHEGIHVAAMIVFARVPLSSLRFGARLSEGVLYVHSDRPMTATAYRLVLILPAIVQGFLPAVAGTLLGMGWLVFYGYVMLVSSIGDFAVLQLIRRLDAMAMVRDHPEEVGCQVHRY